MYMDICIYGYMYICTPWICGGDECEAGSLSFPIHAYQHTYMYVYINLIIFFVHLYLYTCQLCVCTCTDRQTDSVDGVAK
jgi:hypothetical protein